MSLRFPIKIITAIAVVLLILIPSTLHSAGVGVMVKGIVKDSKDHSPLPYAAVKLKGTEVKGLTDENGEFILYVDQPFEAVNVSAVGYKPTSVKLSVFNNSQVINLVPEGLKLSEVTVSQKKKKYSKKENPALEIIEQIRNNKDKHNIKQLPYYSYNSFKKRSLAVNNYDPENLTGLLKLLPTVSEIEDSSVVTGKPILPIYSHETFSEIQYRNNPTTQKEYVIGTKTEGIDGITDPENIRLFFDEIMRDLDIYEDDIVLLRNHFVSPLSRLAPDFYKFFITDTVTVEGDSCIQLSFAPFNGAMFGFTGHLYVKKDSSDYFIKKAVMRVPPTINLNYVKKLKIEQTFGKGDNGMYLKQKDLLAFEAGLIPALPEAYAERVTSYSNYNFNEQDANQAIFKERADVIIAEDATTKSAEFWTEANNTGRILHMDSEAMLEELRKNKIFYWGEKGLKLLSDGYFPSTPTSKVDFGPINTFYSYNDLEGTKLRFGGLTTAQFNDKLFFRGYGAYGFKDKKVKYGAEVEYSFLPKKLHSREFPMHSIAAEYKYDIDKLGQTFMYTNPDNVVLSITRHPNREIIYRRSLDFRYTLELYNHFSVIGHLFSNRRETSRFINFVDGYGKSSSHYTQSGVKVDLRYAPGEKFYQGRTYRIPVNEDAPVFTLSHTFSPTWLFNSKRMISTTEASIFKRFWFSAWGYTDLIVKGGHVWSKVEFPDLLIPNTNLTYTVQPESFALMNPMEFVNDSYASWDLTYWSSGAIFNYVPVLKKMKLREVFSFTGIWGHLSDRNNPYLHPDLFRFPSENYTQKMGKTPYMEVSAGLDNIFTVLRVDYVWRLSYRNRPGCSNSGIQFALHFNF